MSVENTLVQSSLNSSCERLKTVDICLKNRLVFKWHFNKTLCSSNKEIWMLQWFQVRRGIVISDIVLCVKCEWEPCQASIRWTDLYIQYVYYRYYVSATLAILLFSNRGFLMRRTTCQVFKKSISCTYPYMCKGLICKSYNPLFC